MENLPFYISAAFVLTTALTFWLFYKATRNNKKTLLVFCVWLALQTIIGLTGFYTVTSTMPPRLVVLIGPALLLIIMLFATQKGRHYIDGLELKTLTLLNVIRIPVELVLFSLFVRQYIPELMTFEGRNFDILSGITAPLVYYFGFVKKQLGKSFLLFWNFACLGLLINVVTIAILAVPTPFQRLAFDQPNVGVLYFPFIWLPCFIVPVVLFSHLASIRLLLKK